jgi:hypothetical protein
VQVREISCPCCNNNQGLNGYYYQRSRDFDGDGATDVRFFQYDSRPHENVRDRAEPYQEIELREVCRPKVLRKEFFQFQVNVGCWAAPRESDALQLLFRDPPWGYFAVASARAGFQDVTSGAYRYVFDSTEERDQWLASSANMYEPDWNARLWSTAKTIRDEDLDILPGVETSVNWIYKGMAWEANWRSVYNGLPDPAVKATLRQMLRPHSVDDFFDPVHLVGSRPSPFTGARFDLSDIRLKENVKH